MSLRLKVSGEEVTGDKRAPDVVRRLDDADEKTPLSEVSARFVVFLLFELESIGVEFVDVEEQDI